MVTILMYDAVNTGLCAIVVNEHGHINSVVIFIISIKTQFVDIITADILFLSK